MTSDEPDLFEGFQTAASILAFVHLEFGADGLKELLSLVEIDRDSLERDAAELSAVGLPKPAEIVREYAALIPVSGTRPLTGATGNHGRRCERGLPGPPKNSRYRDSQN